MRLRIFVGILVFLFILLIEQTYRSYRFVEDSLVDQIGEFQTSVAGITAQNFGGFLERVANELERLSMDEDVINLNDRGRAKLKNVKATRGELVHRVLALDSNLRIIYGFPEELVTSRSISYSSLFSRKPAGDVASILEPISSEGNASIIPVVRVVKSASSPHLVVLELSERAIAREFFFPLLRVSAEARAYILDSDSRVIWNITGAAGEVAETFLSLEDRQRLADAIGKSRTTKGAVQYYGKIPLSEGSFISGVAGINLPGDGDWHLLSGVPSTTLKSALATYRLISLGMATVIALMIFAFLTALFYTQKESYLAREKGKLADEFQQRLKERTKELALAKEELSAYAKNLEAQVKERTKKLTQSEEMYRQLVEGTGTIIIILRGTKLAYVNPAFLSVWKKKKKASDWLGDELIYLVSPKSRPDVLKGLSRLNDGEDLVELEELEVEESENSKRVWEGALKRVQLVDRHLVFGFFNDITERRALEAQVLQAQKLESMGRLAGGIAHDFNNILAAIFGHLALLKGEVGEVVSPEANELISTIETAAGRAAELTKKLLVFARRPEEIHKPVDINKSLDDVASLIRTSLTAGITLEVKKSAERLIATADPTEVQQVLMNLSINAVEAMPNGGKLTISASLVTKADDPELPYDGLDPKEFVRVRVVDTGHGIAPNVLKQIFEPFFTTKESGKGSGLGLSIAFHIARKHDGFLTVDSDWGRGSVFTLYLPAHVAGEESRVVGVAPPEYSYPDFSGLPPVLMVDDEPLIVESAKKFFAKFGLTMITAGNGVEAIDAFKKRQHEIPLVIIDLNMPRMNGVEAFKLIKTLNSKVVGVLVSGFTDDVASSLFDRAGFSELLRKPFTFEDLSRIFEKYLLPLKRVRA